MDDILKEFVVESRENLDHVERDLVALETSPGSRELLAGIFRAIHSIKGSSGFLALNTIEAVSHAGENLLSRLRDGHLKMTSEIASVLLALVDALRTLLLQVDQTGKEGSETHESLIADLNRLQSSRAEPCRHEPSATNPPPPSSGGPARTNAMVTATGSSPNPTQEKTPSASDPPAPAQPQPAATVPESATTTLSNSPETHVRVDVALLDKLMNLVGELVLARNQIMQLNAGRTETALATSAQRLNLVTTELQAEVMRTRLQPIGTVWSKLPRLVRDAARELGKQVHLKMDGEQTELDRTLIEAIKDPLTHLVRNAIDHGLEAPAERRAAGKAETGLVSLHAYHEGGQVNIEIADDGRGIDIARVKAKGLEKGLLAPDQAPRLTDREALHLVFLAGLSTAEKVTNVSGRGVGMDVVKANIERVGGSVDVQSERGRGTLIKIKIPLTLAIIPALMVTTAGHRYAIPQVNLVELVRLDGDLARTAIENVMGAPVYRLRGRLLPLVYLDQVLGLGNARSWRSDVPTAHGTDPQAEDVENRSRNHRSLPLGERETEDRRGDPSGHSGSGKTSDHSLPLPQGAGRPGHEASSLLFDEALNMVVVQADDQQFGIVVEKINDTQEIVVKPLGKHLKSLAVYAGATILGDGKLALILDVLGLAQVSRVVNKARDRRLTEQTQTVPTATRQRQRLLLFGFGPSHRLAIDLATVGRLEKFPRTVVEQSGGHEVVQYRGQIMRLIRLADCLHLPSSAVESDSIQVVVYSEQGHCVGLCVGEILDIVEEEVNLQTGDARAGVRGRAILQGRVTELLDVPALVHQYTPEFTPLS